MKLAHDHPHFLEGSHITRVPAECMPFPAFAIGFDDVALIPLLQKLTDADGLDRHLLFAVVVISHVPDKAMAFEGRIVTFSGAATETLELPAIIGMP